MPGSPSPTRRHADRTLRRALSPAPLTLLCGIIAALALSACGGSGSTPSGPTPAPTPPKITGPGPAAFFSIGSELAANPVGVLKQVKGLGVDRVHMFYDWDGVAPDPGSRHRPSFDAGNPAAYPAKNWAAYDAVIREAAKLHIKLDVMVGGPPPLWASGSGAPAPADTHPYWKPNVADFGAFMQAVGTRYSGHYTPKGAHSPLPRVNFWSIWNEPNSGVQIAPQTLDGPTVEVAPTRYRQLADAAWTALHKTGHGSDTVLFGELAPVGSRVHGAPGNFAVMSPLRFLRALYCVGTDFKPLTGHQATIRGCPATAAASKRFAAENPVLFKATGFADHPYPQALAPNQKIPQPDDAELGNIDELFSTLDKTQAAYGSHVKLPVWDTEFGYITTPPATQSGSVSPAEAALWINWSEYIHWKTPRLKSYDQYLLADPQPTGNPHGYRAFASGLISYTGAYKPTYDAYRLPLYLPVTNGSDGAQLEVWGDIRPAKLVPTAKRAPAQLQFKPSSGGAWKTLRTISAKTPEGYFDVLQSFPGSGSVRLQWTYPKSAHVYPPATVVDSRTVTISLH